MSAHTPIYRQRNASGMTHKEIGAKLGISRQRVRQIEERAMRKLRHMLGSDSHEPVWKFLSDTVGRRDEGVEQADE